MEKEELKALVKAASYGIKRRKALRVAIKQACARMELEKSAAGAQRVGTGAGQLLGSGLNAIGRAGRSTGNVARNLYGAADKAAPNFVERVGSQLQQRGLRGTMADAGRRFMGRGATNALNGEAPRGWRGYIDNLLGRSESRFMENIEGRTFNDLAQSGSESLGKHLEHGGKGALRRLQKGDRRAMDAIAGDQALLPGGYTLTNAHQIGALERQAARIRQAQRKARIGTAVAAPLALAGGATMVGGGQPEYNGYIPAYGTV